jgi:hypothetical protein
MAMAAGRGMTLDEFDDWKVQVEGTRVTFGGYLDSSGLTRLSSLLDLPTPALYTLRGSPLLKAAKSAADKRPGELSALPEPAEKPAPAEKPEPAAEAPGEAPSETAEATQQYFHATSHLIKDLRWHEHKARNSGCIAQWYANYARNIERLPILQVDEQMLDYGAHVSKELRTSSLTIKNSNIRAHAEELEAANQGVPVAVRRAAMIHPESGTIVVGESTVNRPMTPQERWEARRQARAEENVVAMQSTEQVQADIDAATAAIRTAMTRKYQCEF